MVIFIKVFIFFLILIISIMFDRGVEASLQPKIKGDQKIYRINSNLVIYSSYFVLLVFIFLNCFPFTNKNNNLGFNFFNIFMIFALFMIFIYSLIDKIIIENNSKIIKICMFEKKEVIDIKSLKKIKFTSKFEESGDGYTIVAYIYLMRNNKKLINIIWINNIKEFIFEVLQHNKNIIIRNKSDIDEYIQNRLLFKKGRWIADVIFSCLLYLMYLFYF